MKRSLFITIVVLLMAALFVSCNANKVEEDQLFEVSIDEGARALQATGEFDIDINQYYWFYTATKTSGGFRTGEKTAETPVKTANDAPDAGIIGASLGSFSKGTWEFSFFGYADPADKGTEAKRVYFQTGLSQTVSSAVSLAITLVRGEGALPPATVVFDKPTWYHEDFKTLPANQTTGGYELALKVFVGENATDAWKTVTATTVDGKATFEFAETDVLTLTAETKLLFRVYWGEDLVGSEDLVIPAAGSTKYTVSDLNDLSGITPVDENYGVIIFDASVPGLESTEATGTISVSPVDATVVKAGVAPVATEQTTVTFPAGSFEAAGEHELTIAVADAAAAAETNFVVTNVDTTGAPIAVLSFTLTNAPATFGDEAVEVETFIQPGLDANSIKVIYNGTTGAQPTDVAYDPQTGRLTFKTTHFSDYVVVSTKAVARIGNTLYETLPEACIAALATEGNTVITLLCDASGDGFSPDNAALGSYTIDFAGHTYDVVGLVGSTGTVSQAFRVIQGQTVVLKNGKLTSSTAKMLINQYGNLTLKDMTLDGSNLVASNVSYYTLSVCLGNVVISGNTNIIAHADDTNGKGRAFDIDGSYSGGTNRSVTIADDFTGKISGIIEFTKSRNDSCETKLIVNGGNGDLTEARLTISGLGTNDVIYIDSDVDWVDVYDLTTNTAYSLSDFRDAVNDGSISSDSFVLLRDVDLANAEWTPIGTTDNPFRGVFDGQNHTISNLKVTEYGAKSGLFGVVSGTANTAYTSIDDVWVSNVFVDTAIAESNYTAVIKNLHLEKATVAASGSVKYTAAFAGNINNAYMSNLTVDSTSSVAGNKCVGGIAGSANGSVFLNCENNASIDSYYNVGGIVGAVNYDANNSFSAIVGCSNNGTVAASGTGGGVGGIVGIAQGDKSGVIVDCVNAGTINDTADKYVGGIAGLAFGYKLVSGCTNYGTITVSGSPSDNIVSGIIAAEAASCGIWNCTNNADITVYAKYLAGISTNYNAQSGGVGYVYSCVNTGSLTNTNASGQTMNLALNTSNALFKDKVYADVAAINQEIAGVGSNVTVKFENCTVSNSSGTLILTSSIRGIESNTVICSAVDVSTGNQTALSIDVPNATIAVDSDFSGSLTISGANNTVTVNSGVAVGKLTVSGNGSTVTNNGTVSTLTMSGTGTIIAVNNANISKVGFSSTGTFTFTNNGIVSHTTAGQTVNDHTVSTITACNITINNYGTIEAVKGPYVCSYACLFYNGCTVVVNQYAGSEITSETAGYGLACGSAASVIYKTYDIDGNLTSTVVKK